jgi:hypothetical protein
MKKFFWTVTYPNSEIPDEELEDDHITAGIELFNKQSEQPSPQMWGKSPE